MSGNPLLSVVVPVFNTSETLLQELCDSLCTDIPTDAEIIFVDDGSSTNTARWLDAFVESRDQFAVIHQNNSGQNAARERGVVSARGNYVAFCDSDDELRWDRMTSILQTLRADDVDAVVFNSNFIRDGKETSGYGNSVFPLELCHGDVKRFALSQCAEVWRNIFRRSLLTPEIFCRESYIGEDLAVTFLALAKVCTVRTFDVSPYLYRISDTGIERSADCEMRVKITNVFDFIRKNLGANAFSTYHDELEWQAILHVMNAEMFEILRSQHFESQYVTDLCVWMDSAFPDWKRNPYLRYARKSMGIRTRLITNRHFRTFRLFYKLWSLRKWR